MFYRCRFWRVRFNEWVIRDLQCDNQDAMKSESFVKAQILSNGITFTGKALLLAKNHHAKGQNLCYNLPCVSNALQRPQELLLVNAEDGYETVVSCVAPHQYRQPLVLDADNDNFHIRKANGNFIDNLFIDVVPEPGYYKHKLSDGSSARNYVSACGYDELNIFPWTGCAISKHCAFCGIEKVNSLQPKEKTLSAQKLSRDPGIWKNLAPTYLSKLKEAIQIAIGDRIYREHMHLIIISGNLRDDLLDLEAEIYSQIAQCIAPVVAMKATEGIIAVMEPPPSDDKLLLMKEAGIKTVVFNLEVATEPWASRYCPGKNRLATNYIMQRLHAALKIFAPQSVWSNFVMGLEPISNLLKACSALATEGIVPSANVFHRDAGSLLHDYNPPTIGEIITFFNKLASVYHQTGQRPYYCAKALRTSLTNEAYEGRL